MRQWTQADIAERLGLTQGHVRVMRHRGQLPEPTGHLRSVPWWAPDVIEPWMKERAARAAQEEGKS